jgi:hypothetical protein
MKFRYFLAAFIALSVLCVGACVAQPPSVVQTTQKNQFINQSLRALAQIGTPAPVDSNLIGQIDLRRFDFTTPQKSKDTIVWLITAVLALATGYSKLVQEWAAKEKNIKGFRIALAITPVVFVGLAFGFNGDWYKYLSDAILAILSMGGLAGQFINPYRAAQKNV